MNIIIILLGLTIKMVLSQNCEVCQNIVKEFHVGIKDSDKGNFGGGNTAWEEERLGSFATSETRLIHILDGLCPSGTSNIEKCHSLREESEEYIERWWFEIYRKENNLDSLYDYLCVNHMNVCCPINHYGKKCERCIYYDISQDLLCSGHGKCSGNGTRDGNGTCLCDTGYNGDMCDKCAHGYYNTGNGTCALCHSACSECNGAGVDNCLSCKSGFQMTESVCVDLDECSNKSICSLGKFCLNLPGTFKCNYCDKSCLGCTADGPEHCVTCHTGYQKVDEICVDIDECTDGSHTCHENGQKCTNIDGSFTCDCSENYEKQADGSCASISEGSRDESEL